MAGGHEGTYANLETSERPSDHSQIMILTILMSNTASDCGGGLVQEVPLQSLFMICETHVKVSLLPSDDD